MIQFRFGNGGFDMKVLELDPAKRVLWQVVDGPLSLKSRLETGKGDPWPNEIKLDSWE